MHVLAKIRISSTSNFVVIVFIALTDRQTNIMEAVIHSVEQGKMIMIIVIIVITTITTQQ